MSFRSLRESNRLSQEKLAEMSGLSLRTIQRVEAGHRVSYASLRALAATFQMDVDVLERELYAMKQSAAEEFVEVPRWVRLWTNAHWATGPRPTRRQAHMAEAFCMVGGVVFLAVSFLVTASFMATMFRVGAAFMLISGYLCSVTIRLADTYKLWPTTEVSAWKWKPARRTLRGTIRDYTFVLVVLVSFWSIWLAG